MRALFAFLTLGLVATIAAREPERDFTSSDGKVLRATLVDANAEKVILERSGDGRQFTLPLDRLSEADQDYAKAWVLENAPVSHPIGWKRLRIHAPHGASIMEGDRVSSQISPLESKDIYLRVGSWVKVSGSFKQYQGESDWYVTRGQGSRLYISTTRDKPCSIAGFSFVGDGTGHPDEEKMPTQSEALKLVKAGASVRCMHESYLASLTAAGAELSGLSLATQNPVAWHQLPATLQALSLTAPHNVDFAGIEALKNLETLHVTLSKDCELSNLKHLAKLTKLASLSLTGITTPAELPHLRGITTLRQLRIREQSERDAFDPQAFAFVSKLTALESLHLGSHYVRDKLIDPATLKNCPKLTRYTFSHAAFTDQGAFLNALPNLTELDFGEGKVSTELAQRLMGDGHFKHVQKLATTGRYTLNNLPELHTLRLTGAGSIAALAKSGPLPKLRTLSLRDQNQKRLEELSALPLAKRIKKIYLGPGSVGPDLTVFANFPALSEPEFTYARDLPALDLAPLPNLRSLSLAASNPFESITNLGNLRRLKISSNTVKELGDGVGCPNLEFLELQQVEELQTLAGFGDCPKLRYLQIDYCKDLNTTARLEQSPSLEYALIRQSGTVPDYTKDQR